MRGLVLVVVYVLAIGVGFLLRGRYDVWIFSKHHMQQRYRVFAAEVISDPDPVGQTLYFPPLTTDHYALSAARTRAWLQEYSALAEPEPGLDPAGSPASDPSLPTDSAYDLDLPQGPAGSRPSPPNRPIEPA